MQVWEFTLVLWSGAMGAGFLGSLTGLGGGVVIVPLLTIAMGVDIHYAIGASLVSVIATSCGAAAAYVKEGYTNMRIGMFLEIATTLGAVAGAFLAYVVSPGAIAIVFGVVLIVSAILAGREHRQTIEAASSGPVAKWLRMDGHFPTPQGLQAYHVRRVPGGFGLMFIAGILSGLLGIGGGAFKVLAMDQVMKVPFKVSTTTSNFMIGVTAAASAGVYLGRGYIDPALAMPVMLGVLLGALFGARVLVVARVKTLRIVFAVVIVALGVEMILQGIKG